MARVCYVSNMMGPSRLCILATDFVIEDFCKLFAIGEDIDSILNVF